MDKEADKTLQQIAEGKLEAPTLIMTYLSEKWRAAHDEREVMGQNLVELRRKVQALHSRHTELMGVCKEYRDNLREEYAAHLQASEDKGGKSNGEAKFTDEERRALLDGDKPPQEVTE